MKIFFTGKFLLYIILTVEAANIYGQGTLRGSVTDSLSRDPLFGANVYLVGTALGTAVDIEGHYTVSGIPLGHYKLRISYLGYKSKEFSIDIDSSRVKLLDIQLAPAAILGQEVVVSAQAEGQAAAINRQLSSNTIVNVVSEQKILELPDANAAESIGRLPGVSLLRSGGEANQVVMRGLGPQFSTVTIDGVRMASTDQNDQGIDLSTIAQGSLAGIELFKAITADKDADAIAGTINLVTKKAPSRRMIRFESFGSYNNLDRSAGQYNFQGRYGERFFNDVLGVQADGNLEKAIRSSESTNYNYDLTGIASGNDYEITQFEVTYINEIRKRGGASLLFDINTPDKGSIRFNTVYNKTSRSYITSYRTYAMNGGVIYDYRDINRDIEIFNTSLHGENHLFGLDAFWNLSFAQSGAKNPFDYEMNFTESSALDSTGKPISGMQNIPPQYSRGPVDVWIPYAINNFQAAYLYSADDRGAKNLEKQKTAYLDLLRHYSFSSSVTGTFKFGGKYRENGRSNDESQSRSNYYLYTLPQYTKSSDGTIVEKNFNGTQFQNLIIQNQRVSFANFLNAPPGSRSVYDKYALNPLINRDALDLWRQLNINGYIDQSGSNPEYIQNHGDGGDGSYYDIMERILAGYAMNTLNIGPQITFIAGVRTESDNNDYKSRFTPIPLSGFPFGQGFLRDTLVHHKETTVLPNFHLIFRPLYFMNIRLAAYKALARPDFNYRLLKFIATSASGNSVYIGNPDLNNAVAWNFEIQTQFYGNGIGLFSISAFYKNIENMYHYINDAQLTGQRGLDSLGIPWKDPFPSNSIYSLYYPYNSNKPTKVWGFEVEHQANFRFLPGLLKNIVLNYNFSIVRSETWAPVDLIHVDTVQRGPIKVPVTSYQLVERKQKLESQPEFFGNVSLGYDIYGFSLRVAAFYQGKYNSSFSFDGRGDGEQDSYTRLDIALKQQITDNVSVFLNLNNITNTREGNIVFDRITGWELPNTNYMYGLTADFGARVDL